MKWNKIKFQEYLRKLQKLFSVKNLYKKITDFRKIKDFNSSKLKDYGLQLKSKSKEVFKKVKEEKLKDYQEYLTDWKKGRLENTIKLGFLNKAITYFNFTKNKILYLHCLTIFICCYLIATLLTVSIDALLPEYPPLPKTIYNQTSYSKGMSHYEIIASRNLFNKDGIVPDMSAFDESMPAVKTRLPFTLLGIILLQDKIKSIASVLDRSKNEVITVRTKDPINSNTEVKEILQDKLLFYNQNTQQIEYIALPKVLANLSTRPSSNRSTQKSDRIKEINENYLTIERSEIDQALSDMNKLITQLRCVESIEGGTHIGFKCDQIVPGSIYDKIGIQNNDVIISINGEKLTNPGKAFRVLRSLKNESRIQVTLKRSGKVIRKKYDIL